MYPNTQESQENFGIACKYFREQINLSQEKFALKIGMDRTYYASVEAGKETLPCKTARKLQMALKSAFQGYLKR